MFAGFWVRVVAAIADTIIVTVGFCFLEKATGIAFYQTLMDDYTVPVKNLTLTVIAYFLWFLYFVLFVASPWQATPGKRLFHIYIVPEDGDGRISLLRSFVREIFTCLSFLLLFIGYIMIAFTREKTGLHDLIAGTRVVYGKAP